MAAKIVLCESDLLTMAKMIAAGEDQLTIRRRFGIGENKYYAIRTELLKTGKLRKDELGKLTCKTVYNDGRISQTIEGNKRTINFSDRWKPQRALPAGSKVGVGSSLSQTQFCCD